MSGINPLTSVGGMNLLGGGMLQDPRMAIVNSLMQQGQDASPVRSGWQEAARAAQGIIGALMYNKVQGENSDAMGNLDAFMKADPATQAEMAKANPRLQQIAGVMNMQSNLLGQEARAREEAKKYAPWDGKPGEIHHVPGQPDMPGPSLWQGIDGLPTPVASSPAAPALVPASGPADSPPVAPAPVPARVTTAPTGDGKPTNNPLNMRFPGQTQFQSYPSEDDAYAAALKQLKLYQDRGQVTPYQMIAGIGDPSDPKNYKPGWAPPSDNNNIDAYMATLKKNGVNPNQPVDLSNPDEVTRLFSGMATQEGARPNPAAILAGFAKATAPTRVAQGGPVASDVSPGVPSMPSAQAAPAAALGDRVISVVNAKTGEGRYVKADDSGKPVLGPNGQPQFVSVPVGQRVAADGRLEPDPVAIKAAADAEAAKIIASTGPKVDQETALNPILAARAGASKLAEGAAALSAPPAGAPSIPGAPNTLAGQQAATTTAGTKAAENEAIPNQPMSQEQKIAAEQKANDAFLNMPQVKEHYEVAKNYQSVVAAAPKDTKASDIDFIDGLVKMFNPGATVRQSTFENFMEHSQDIPDNIIGIVKSWYSNQAHIQPEARQQLLEQATSRMQSSRDSYQQFADATSQTAKTRGLDPTAVVPKFEDPLTKMEREKAAAAAAKPTASARPNWAQQTAVGPGGHTIYYNGSAWVDAQGKPVQ